LTRLRLTETDRTGYSSRVPSGQLAKGEDYDDDNPQ
jgi:hypothetical protein